MTAAAIWSRQPGDLANGRLVSFSARLQSVGALVRAAPLLGILVAGCGGDAGGPSEPKPQSCIPSGDQTAINQALTGKGAHAVLCQNAVFALTGTVIFTADSQQVYTEGRPTDGTRATLRIAAASVWSAVDMNQKSYTVLSNVIVDGNHPLAGETLRFSVKLLSVRGATEEELSHGHVHGPDGHHHPCLRVRPG